jgi:hypothetical protein
MDANTTIVLAGLILVGLAWTALVLGTIAALVRDALAPRVRARGPARPPRPRRTASRRVRTTVQARPDSAPRPLSWEALEGK